MPTTTTPLTLGAKNSNIDKGTQVTFRNLSRSGKETVMGKSGEAVSKGNNWENGDKISIEVYGKYNASKMVTASGGGAKNSFTLSEDTSTPAINL